MQSRPFDTAAIAAYPDKRSWQAVADELLHDVLTRWSLTVAGSHSGGRAGIVAEVVQQDGAPAVLKLGVPHEDGRWEAIALEAFPAGTAPKLLRQDVHVWALLLESIHPGTPLRDASIGTEAALKAGGRLHARIASASGVHSSPLPRVSDVAARGALQMRDSLVTHHTRLERLGIEVEPLQRARAELARLAALSTAWAFVHGDFNPGNVVLSTDEGVDRWMVIDPKGMIGDPAYDLWPLVTQLGAPLDGPKPVRTLTDQLLVAADAAALDARRAAEWGFARAGQTTLWFVEDGDDELALVEARVQAAWAGVLERLH